MNKKSIIIIDDEFDARRVLRKYMERYFPDFVIVGEADNVERAVNLLNQVQADIVFLDINLGDGTGFDVLDTVDAKPGAIIFTTAFDQYALKAFNYHALDYLLKPIEPDSFVNAVERILSMSKKEKVSNIDMTSLLKSLGQSDRKLGIPTSEGLKFILLERIVMFVADASYCSVFLDDRSEIVVSKPLKFFSDKLESMSTFLRPHKSYIINVHFIEEYIKEDGGSLKLSNGKLIPISRQKKDEILKELNNSFI